MRQVAIVLVHNKTPEENEAQIQALLAMVQRQSQDHDEFDEKGEVTGSYQTFYYTLSDFPDIELRFYHVVPYGVERPPSMDLLDGHKVIYGAGDEDKTGDHPRFFNWGTKRATDFGAEAVIHLEDYTRFNPKLVITSLEKVLDKNDSTEIVDDQSMKLVSVKFLREQGQLDETKTKTEAFEEYKGKVEQKEVKHG